MMPTVERNGLLYAEVFVSFSHYVDGLHVWLWDGPESTDDDRYRYLLRLPDDMQPKQTIVAEPEPGTPEPFAGVR